MAQGSERDKAIQREARWIALYGKGPESSGLGAKIRP